MSRAGLIAAVLYLVPVSCLLAYDSQQTHGGWINLRTLLPAVLTLPVSFPLESLGMLPDLTRNSNVAMLVIACAFLVYCVTAAVAEWFTSR